MRDFYLFVQLRLAPPGRRRQGNWPGRKPLTRCSVARLRRHERAAYRWWPLGRARRSCWTRGSTAADRPPRRRRSHDLDRVTPTGGLGHRPTFTTRPRRSPRSPPPQRSRACAGRMSKLYIENFGRADPSPSLQQVPPRARMGSRLPARQASTDAAAARRRR